MSQQQHTPIRPQEEEINLREELDKYLKYWPWFVFGVILCVLIGFVYLKYTTAQYSTTASIIIKDEESKGPSSEMAAFADLGLLSGMGASSIENEIGILKSKTLMTQTIKALDLNITYYDEAGVKSRELYNNSPFNIKVLQLDEEKLSRNIKEELGNRFLITPQSKNDFTLKNTETDKTFEGKFGNPVNIGFADITLEKTVIELGDEDEDEDLEVSVQFSPVEAVVRKYREGVQVNLTDKNSSLLVLSLVDPVTEKAQDILDQLILEYNRQAIEDKNLVATNTASFIDERLSIINQELDSVEVGKEEFKESNQLTNIEAESELFIENASDYKKRQQEVGTQLELANAMLDHLKGNRPSDLLPANLGIQEEGVNDMIKEYNTLVLERNRILSASTEENPVVVRLNSQIDQMRGNVLQSLERMRSNLLIAQEDLDRQAAVIGSQISAVPAKERQYRGIERQQNIKEALYLFLLEKREENSLSLAVTAPKAKIVDSAYSDSAPVSPKSKIILLAALILGLLIPFLIIYVKNLLNNKVTDRTDIENATKEIPIVGEIPRIARKENDLISVNDRSVLAEAFRIMVTNLQYLLVGAGDKEKGIKLFVTSTVKGEGKTFIAFNLAITLANMGKKVVIIGADLRNPQLQRYETKARSYSGVSDYLYNADTEIKDIITTAKAHEKLDIIASGHIPPNPSELLRSERMAKLLSELEGLYDYIIVDTAPSMLVADTFLINKYADLTLYVARAGYTEKKLLGFAVDAKNEGKLHDVSFVLNDVELANFGYGNKYGYAYGEEKKSFFKRLKEKAAAL
ncbi:GumC family protein [Salegentibacter salegens]|uniref:non-specific protein-tyrosine kinase n=1 Tax=Salegentibacter salegens TaxID=143223 RepID=A0A1M7L5S6_9FLAO|nr:polysaccharide biosynthesis tyrosine autokinase [Salegentibacter salegens]PRX38811.1 capsular exopolysaccharide synthesis family protein [Salegentibacter salegens]SHM72830.1 capsular exopolysaccharide family [Salegentibacter salegens]SHM72975.1 capsular exopolysaccharide family [Salegentibacter salegens]